MEILKTFYTITLYLFPLFGLVVLGLLGVILYNTNKGVLHVNGLLAKANDTMTMVNSSIDELQAPISTFVKISHTIDVVHDFGESAVRKLVNRLAEGLQALTRLVERFLSAPSRTPEDENHG